MVAEASPLSVESATDAIKDLEQRFGGQSFEADKIASCAFVVLLDARGNFFAVRVICGLTWLLD